MGESGDAGAGGVREPERDRGGADYDRGGGATDGRAKGRKGWAEGESTFCFSFVVVYLQLFWVTAIDRDLCFYNVYR